MIPRPRPLDRIPPFWLLQAAGWSAFAVSMALSRVGQFPLGYMLVSKGMLALLGFAVSSGLRPIYRRIFSKGSDPRRAVPVAIVASYVASMVWTAVHNLFDAPFASYYFEQTIRIETAGQLLSGTVYHAFTLLAWSGLYFGIKYHQELQAERERSLAAEALVREAHLNALRYQLNPHFLFNTLNAISTLVVEARTREAGQMISRLSDFLRITLESADVPEVTLAEELDFARQYLAIEQIRFGERLSVRVDIEPDALPVPVPALILQPIVENAIRHGIAPRKTPGVVEISARVEGASLRIRITNDGPVAGASAPAGPGVGLANIRARLERLYDQDAGLELEPAKDSGVVVTLTLPATRTTPAPASKRGPADVP